MLIKAVSAEAKNAAKPRDISSRIKNIPSIPFIIRPAGDCRVIPIIQEGVRYVKETESGTSGLLETFRRAIIFHVRWGFV